MQSKICLLRLVTTRTGVGEDDWTVGDGYGLLDLPFDEVPRKSFGHILSPPAIKICLTRGPYVFQNSQGSVATRNGCIFK